MSEQPQQPVFRPPTGKRPPHVYCHGCGRDLPVWQRPAPGLPGVCDDCARGAAPR